MKLLQSKKLKLPPICFITDREELKELTIGVPFIYGSPGDEKHIIRILEYEVLYQRAVATGLPFNFRKILEDNGYSDIDKCYHNTSSYIDYATTETSGVGYDIESQEKFNTDSKSFQEYIRDSSVYVDIAKIKELNIIPVWLDTIEEAISTNIHNFAVFNPNMYNKKLDGMYGGIDLVSPNRNLIIIDISGSIPRGVSSTILTLAKHLAETFYADIMITGSITTLYTYEEIHSLEIETIYDTNGMSNDQRYYKNLLSADVKHYDTVIAFGDDDHPGHSWCGSDNYISDEDGKKLCLWKTDKLISFHTKSIDRLAGYARWLNVEEESIKRISDWVSYL